MDGVVKGARVEIDCPEPEVFIQICGNGGKQIKATGTVTTGGKLTRKFETDEEVECTGFKGKSYRFGASADIKAQATLSLQSGRLTFSFKYTVCC